MPSDRVRQFRTPDGKPLTLGVPPTDPEAGHDSAVVVRTPEEFPMSEKVDKNGVYVLNGRRFVIAAGDVLPDGAELVADEQRAVDKAPENKSKPAAPENRAKKAD